MTSVPNGIVQNLLVAISVKHYESLSFQDDFNWLCKFPKKVW